MSGNKDHPRACGANIISVALCFIRLGSSPRMRGKPIGAFRFFGCVRIIPAHAGQTCNHGQLAEPVPDHPRACGANPFCLARVGLSGGSSPRMRGKPVFGGECTLESRIIPAHAGQTPSRRRKATRCPDHPRACGANAPAAGTCRCAPGSSPRMRGKQRFVVSIVCSFRIIPAHAGQTSRRRGSR